MPRIAAVAMLDLQGDLRMRILVSARRMRRDLERRAHEVGLTVSALGALHALLHAGREGLSPAALARRLGCTPSVATAVTYELELAGYIEVLRDLGAPRYKCLQLTAAGLEAYVDATEVAVDGLTREEMRTVYAVLDHLEAPSAPRSPRSRFRHFVQSPNTPSIAKACSPAEHGSASETVFTRRTHLP